MLVGFLALIAPECPGPLASAEPNQITVSATPSDSLVASASFAAEDDRHTSPQNDCDDCGNPNHVCHHCHFGHCGFVANQTKFSPFENQQQYGSVSPTLVLKSFITSLFRPPIA